MSKKFNLNRLHHILKQQLFSQFAVLHFNYSINLAGHWTLDESFLFHYFFKLNGLINLILNKLNSTVCSFAAIIVDCDTFLCRTYAIRRKN